MSLLTEVKNTKFTEKDAIYIDGVIKKLNKNKTEKDSKFKLASIMREATLREIKRLDNKKDL